MADRPVAFADLYASFDFVSAGAPSEHQAWLCRTTGTMHWYSEMTDLDEPLPVDIDDADHYLAIPHKKDLGLGKPLGLAFTRKYLPECFEQVRAIFARPGAYARFKDLLVARNRLAAWHEYEDAQSRYALRHWCADHGIALKSEL